MSILMTVVGSQQGQIYGAGPNREWSVLSVSSGIQTPVDTVSGLPSGRRQHEPCVCVVDYGENITSLMKAISNAENLTVTMTYVDDTTGDVYIRAILSNAQLFGYSQSSGGDRPTESLSFTFQKIQYAAGNTTYSSSWESGGSTGA